jgi:hypothetical protein
VSSYKNIGIFFYVFDEGMQHVGTNTSKIPFSLEYILNKKGIFRCTDYKKASILFTSKLDDIHKLTTAALSDKNKLLYGLRCVNMIASKSTLASVVKAHDEEMADKILPKTWILRDKHDHHELITQEFTTEGLPKRDLILKKNIQRQNGITFVNSIRDIESEKDNVICQELLHDPYIVNGHKINIRIYLLMIADQDKQRVSAYIFNDGVVYYTQDSYDPNRLVFSTQITTGYINRTIYEKNPLSLHELYEHMGNADSKILMSNIRTLFTSVCKSYEKVLRAYDLDGGVSRFLIFGCDIYPFQNLDVKLIEINKGPDLNAKDTKDGEIKYALIHEALQLVNVTHRHTSDSNYIKVL